MKQKRSVDNVNALPLKKYVTFIGNEKSNRWICDFGCRPEPYTGVYASIKRHLIGWSYPQKMPMGIPLCDKVPENVREQMRKEENEAKMSLGKMGIRIRSPPPSDANLVDCAVQNIVGLAGEDDIVTSTSVGSIRSLPPSDANLVDCAVQTIVGLAGEDDIFTSTSVGSIRSPPPSDANLVDCAVLEMVELAGEDETVTRAMNGGSALLGTSSDTPLDVPSSPEEAKPMINLLAMLKPPQPRDYNLVSPEILRRGFSLAPQVKSFLVSQLLSTADIEQMIDFANSSFKFLDTLCTDYTPFYKKVHAFISYHFDRLTAEAGKNSYAFHLKAKYEAFEARLKEAGKAHLKAEMDLSEANEKLAPLRAKHEEAKRALKAIEEKLAEGEGVITVLEAENSRCSEAYAKAKSEMDRLAPEYREAMVLVRDTVERLDTAILGVTQMKAALLSSA